MPEKEDFILPFQLESCQLRGRIIRLHGAVDDILGAHAYPEKVSRLLGETVTLCGLLSSMLKYRGIFTLQVQGSGPLSMLVSDINSDGGIRACAAFKEEALAAAGDALPDLTGKGHIAFTVDQGPETDRYQGIVELKGRTLLECVQHYFAQSEQIETGIVMGVGLRDGKWRAQGLMLQRMPEEGGTASGNIEEDDWRRAMILMQSCKEDELLDPGLSADILTRLFHEEGVRVYDPRFLEKTCRCSFEKVEAVLKTMPEEDKQDMAEDGVITMTCEFCNQDYVFDL